MKTHTDIKNGRINLSNGDKQITSEHKLIIYSCSNAWWEPWMNFDWWHLECTATFFIIVTIVEIHRLIIDVCVSLKNRRKVKNCVKKTFIKLFLIHCKR